MLDNDIQEQAKDFIVYSLKPENKKQDKIVLFERWSESKDFQDEDRNKLMLEIEKHSTMKLSMHENIIKDVVAHKLNSAYMSVEQILRRAAFIRKAFTIDELMRRTSPKSVRKKNNCHAHMTRATPKIGLWLFSVKCGEHYSKGPYDVRFKITKDQRLKDMSKRDIKTSCNCNAWKYNGSDYNSLHEDYNERQYSDNSAPNIRDPHRINLICKHVAACIPTFARFIVPEEYKGLERREPGTPTTRPAPTRPTPRKPTPRPGIPKKPIKAPTQRPTRQLRTPPTRGIK